jgi:sterol desaturase/sphingolipid hydroxylase (fatty acid hydroxylase superfamily)
MALSDHLFKPRNLPHWWVRFTSAYPIVPNFIAVAGLIWICFLLAPIISGAEKHGHGELVETIGVISGSKTAVEKAISVREIYHSWFPKEVRDFVSNLYSNMALYLLVPFLLLLEYLFPCKTSQPLIGKGFLQDAVWYATIAPLRVLLLFPVSQCLRGIFTDHLSFLTLTAATAWPVYTQIIAAILLTEFLMWFNHFVRHKIRSLWFFHAVHHSQKELNVFTDDRGHFIDQLVGSLLAFVPFFIFDVSDLYVVSVIGLYMPIHNRFVHANIKINLGWLGWLITSPQFHRVHHSADAAHLDKNFGVHLSLFDYLFGTAYKSRFVYPETGIEDPKFPLEENVRIWKLPVNWIKQTTYPFLQLFERPLSYLNRSNFKARHFSKRNKPGKHSIEQGS